MPNRLQEFRGTLAEPLLFEHLYDLRARHVQLHERITEGLNGEQLAERDVAGVEVGADAAWIHERDRIDEQVDVTGT